MRLGLSLILLTLITTTLPAFAAVPAKTFHVTIDPGHGGQDTGAVRDEVQESAIALQVAVRLKKKLSEHPGFVIRLTRESNQYLSLQQRTRFADRNQTDLLISLHLNSNPSARARGVEVYFQNHLAPDEETYYLADIEKNALDLSRENSEPSRAGDVSAIIEDLHRQHRMKLSRDFSFELMSSWQNQGLTIKQAPFYVVSRSKAPAVLVELGFLTNAKEAQRLVQPEFQQQAVDKIAKAVENYVAKLRSEPQAAFSQRKL